MKKILKFEDTDEGRFCLRFLFDGCLFGAPAAGNAQNRLRSKEEVRRDAHNIRLLQSISVPAADLKDRHDKARDLDGAPRELVVEVADIERMEKCMLAVPWGGGDSVEVAEVYDFLSSAADYKEEAT